MLSIVDTSLITSTVLTGGISIATLASGVGLPVGITLGGTSLLFFPYNTRHVKASIVAREKHDSIKLLAQGKLDNTANIISQALQDGDISPTEFHRILQEKEKYRKFKVDINNQVMAKLKKIMKEQKKKYLNKEKKEVKKTFYEKLQTLEVSRVSMPFKI